MTKCQEAIYSEEYEDYIIEYAGQEQDVSLFSQVDCYQMLGMGFGTVYQRADRVKPQLREAPLLTPRCFGLISSEQMLEEAGITRARSQPRLELFGQGVLFGIIDTGAAVQKVVLTFRINLTTFSQLLINSLKIERNIEWTRDILRKYRESWRRFARS